MSIDHSGFDVFVTQKFLDGADVVAVLEQMGGEGVAEAGFCSISSIFLASDFSCAQAFSTPAHPPLTRIVEWQKSNRSH